MKNLKLQHNFLTEITEDSNIFNNSNFKDNQVTIVMLDGKFSVNKLIFVLAGEFWKDLLLSIDEEVCTIIIPEFKLSFLYKMIEIISTGSSNFNFDDKKCGFLDFMWNVGQFREVEFGAFKNFKKTFSTFHNLNKYECKYCTREFRSKQARQNHEKHCKSSEKKWKCDKCDKSFKTQQGLISHQPKHFSDQITYVCNSCPNVYQTLSELRKHCHLMDHSYPAVEGPILENEERCKLCYKVMKSYFMKYHMYSQHSPVEFHQCKECNYKTLRKNNLSRHLKQQHNTHNMNFDVIREHFIKSNSYECPKCKRIFDSYQTTVDHMKLQDCEDDDRFVCKVCNKEFTMKQNLKTHVKKKHPDVKQ